MLHLNSYSNTIEGKKEVYINTSLNTQCKQIQQLILHQHMQVFWDINSKSLVLMQEVGPSWEQILISQPSSNNMYFLYFIHPTIARVVNPALQQMLIFSIFQYSMNQF